MKKEDLQALDLLLSTPKKIAIIPHRSPDGDAMGSTLALYHFLIKLNHIKLETKLIKKLIKRKSRISC